jgi:Ca-activated chloride channel family protein
MKARLLLIFLLFVHALAAHAQTETPRQSLNHYMVFLNRSTAELTNRFEMLRGYQEASDQYRKRPGQGLRLPSSGPLEEFYYQKALNGAGINTAQRQNLNAGAREIWSLLERLDEGGKALETYVRLNAYKEDNLKKSDALLADMQAVIAEYSRKKTDFYNQIKQVYLQYQPFVATDPYLSTAKEMDQVLLSQQQLLQSLPYYLQEENRTDWPVALVQRSLLEDETLAAGFGKSQSKLAYPASDVVKDFKSALLSMQDIKKRAIDDHNFAARQSARHGNEVYLSLLKQYNQDLLVTYNSFINYSQSARQMLYQPAFSPVFASGTTSADERTSTKARPFEDKPTVTINIKRAASPPSAETVRALNDYVGFINESLRQMHLMQLLVRNYQSSAEYYRDPARAGQRATLTYSHDDFKVPLSEYQLLINASNAVPQSYRPAINGQAEVLKNILQEMDALSIELIGYTTDKQYLRDQLKRSDAILDRYSLLFEIFDQKKEQLYLDVRRIHESFPNANPSGSWSVSGNALLKTMDDDREVLFGIKSYLKGEKAQIPSTDKVEAGAKQLIADEYQNMKGLKRYGRSNGLCPYSPYEDIAANSSRFAEKALKVKPVSSSGTSHPFESFYYFYNNELVYEYNKFIELANAGLLKMINQPDLFAFRRLGAKNAADPQPVKKTHTPAEQTVKPETISAVNSSDNPPKTAIKPATAPTERPAEVRRDTVYVERVRVDTVFVDRSGSRETTRSLEGFAANNMVLLLDVSSSMNSPFKMPLLKRSIKSLLTLLRPEDQISVVLYSGKARVVLKPTSGTRSAEIARMIDLLKSDGDTDGNEGIRLAYKTANKSYIRGGNNRIVLATDGEFPVSDEVLRMIGENARQDLYLTVLTFGRNEHAGQKLRKLSELGLGTYAHVTEESADLQLILEAQGKKQAAK